VVYVDNDPIVLVHARALMTSTPEGRTAYLDADLSDPEAILASAEVADVLDLNQPVALSLIAVLHFFKDAQDPHGIVARLLDALPSGSYLALSHATWDYTPQERYDALAPTINAEGQNRDRAEFAKFFTGLELVDPGITLVSEWRRNLDTDGDTPDRMQISTYGAVARKP
jgi:hypothetical protein